MLKTSGNTAQNETTGKLIYSTRICSVVNDAGKTKPELNSPPELQSFSADWNRSALSCSITCREVMKTQTLLV